MQALPAQPESLCIVEMGGTEKQDELGERGSIGFLYLNIGLQVREASLVLTVLDELSLERWIAVVIVLSSSCSATQNLSVLSLSQNA